MKPNSSTQLQSVIDATTKSMAHQSAELWLEHHPSATAAELLSYLAERADAARAEAIVQEMAVGGSTREEAEHLIGRMTDYRDVLRAEGHLLRSA